MPTACYFERIILCFCDEHFLLSTIEAVFFLVGSGLAVHAAFKGISINGGTPSHHLNFTRTLSPINQAFSVPPWLWKPPCVEAFWRRASYPCWKSTKFPQKTPELSAPKCSRPAADLLVFGFEALKSARWSQKSMDIQMHLMLIHIDTKSY